jgi:TonB-linked SusC/RagA family outer membrane protein
MRKQYLTFLSLAIAVLTQYRDARAQDFAFLPPALSQRHEDERNELKVVLISLEKKFHVYFTFESQIIRNKFISREVKITDNLEETLMNVLRPLNLKFKKISDKYYTIYPKDDLQQRQKESKADPGTHPISLSQGSFFMARLTASAPRFLITVTGTVTDENNMSLPGVNVLEKGTTNGTATDASGKFTLNVQNENSVLVFSFIGYTNMEIPINGRSVINTSLTPSVQALQEVVVIGYGSVERKELTGSVGSVGSGEIKDLPVARLDQALSGKLAGVQVQSVSGEPGVAPHIRIRGVGSISAGGDPLYVVDGFPTDDIQMINPNDIETIDVLKDASATAIYGSRGANGVIIINTKRGKSGKSIISFDTYYGWQKVLKTPEFLTVKEQAQYYYTGVENQNIDAGKDVFGDPLNWFYKVPVTIMDVLEGRNTTNSKPYDAIFRTAPQQSYNLSAKGGNEGVQYAISGEYLNQDGIIITSNFKRYSLRANLDAKLSDRLSVKLNLNTAYTTNNDIANSGGSGGGEGIIGAASTWEYWYPLYNPDGTYFSGYGQDATNNVWNPIATAKEIKRKSESIRTLANLNTAYKISDALRFNIMVGANTSNYHYYSFIPKLDVFANVTDGADERSSYLNWITESTLNYNQAFNNHNLSGLIGYTTQKQANGSNYVRSRDYPNNLIYTLNAASNIIYQGNSQESEWTLISYLTRINYNFNAKYYLTASIRADGSSRFGPDKKYGYFPSAAIAWRISDESFLKDSRFVNDLKIRTSYGETGNNNIGNYAHIGTVNYESYAFGGDAVGGYAPAQFANSALTWEKQRSFNTGIDASLLNSRLSITADYFKTTNHNLLLNVFVPLVTGFNTSLENIGEVENKGWEFTLSTKNLVGTFQWSTDFNISAFRNKVTKLGPEGAPIISSYHITKIGQPMGMFYGYITDGVFMNQSELDAGPAYNPGASDQSRVGDIRFKDVSGPDGVPDGVVNTFDRTIIGSPYPDFYYGMTNRFSFKNISLSVNIQGTHGNSVFSNSDNFLYTRARYKQLSIVKDYWKSESEPGDGVSPRPNNNPKGGLRQKSTRFLDTGTFFRINNINLSYTFSDPIARRLSLSSLRVYVTANNPLLVTKYNFFNPEVSNSSNPLNPGVNNYNYPLAKSLMVGLNLSF